MVQLGQFGGRLRHAATGLELHFGCGEWEFTCNGKLFRLPSGKLGDAVCAMIESHPRSVSHKMLFEHLNVAQAAQTQQTIHRIMFQIRSVVEPALAGRAPYPFCNYRGRGYGVDENAGWTPVNVTSVATSMVDQALQALWTFIGTCKEIAVEAPVKTTLSGISRAEISDDIRATHVNKIEALSRMLIDALYNDRNRELVLAVKGLLNHLVPYVTFLRMGDRLTAEKWKADYMQEIDELMSRIDASINLARRAA